MTDGDLPHELTTAPALEQRHFAVTRVWIDATGMRVAYVVDEDRSLDWQFSCMEGTDDLDTEYPTRGGVMSPSVDGRHDGVLSVDTPVAGARQVSLRITWDDGRSGQSAELVVALRA